MRWLSQSFSLHHTAVPTRTATHSDITVEVRNRTLLYCGIADIGDATVLVGFAGVTRELGTLVDVVNPVVDRAEVEVTGFGLSVGRPVLV